MGVNLLPSKGKLCNFDCIYCECGWNKDGTQDHALPDYAAVSEALAQKIAGLAAEGVHIDSITFSGNGEPTIHPDFPEIVDLVIALRDRYYPFAKVSVLSNATMIGREKVRMALKRIDNPILKIDASNDSLISLINRPEGNYKLENVVRWLKDFGGDFILQTMFLRSPDFDLSQQEQLDAWMDIVREIHPREIMVYTIDRETPDSTLGKYTVEQMREFVRPLSDEGFNIQIRG